MQALPSRGLYKDWVHGPPSTASSRWETDVEAGHSPRGEERGRRRDCRCVTETMVKVSYSERRERCGRASFPRKMRDTIIVGDPLISDGRSGSHPANTVFETSRLIKRISGRTGASLWFHRYTCGFSVAQLRKDNAICHRHATTVRGPAPEAHRHIIGRCHVALHGRPSSSFDCQRRNSTAWYIGNCVFRRLENSLFYDPRISRPPNF